MEWMYDNNNKMLHVFIKCLALFFSHSRTILSPCLFLSCVKWEEEGAGKAGRNSIVGILKPHAFVACSHSCWQAKVYMPHEGEGVTGWDIQFSLLLRLEHT